MNFRESTGISGGYRIMGFILDFLFGKTNNIFNKKGTVEHDLGKKKWENWNNRLQENPDYDWRHHKGRQGSQEPQKTEKQKSIS